MTRPYEERIRRLEEEILPEQRVAVTVPSIRWRDVTEPPPGWVPPPVEGSKQRPRALGKVERTREARRAVEEDAETAKWTKPETSHGAEGTRRTRP